MQGCHRLNTGWVLGPSPSRSRQFTWTCLRVGRCSQSQRTASLCTRRPARLHDLALAHLLAEQECSSRADCVGGTAACSRGGCCGRGHWRCRACGWGCDAGGGGSTRGTVQNDPFFVQLRSLRVQNATSCASTTVSPMIDVSSSIANAVVACPRCTA